MEEKKLFGDIPGKFDFSGGVNVSAGTAPMKQGKTDVIMTVGNTKISIGNLAKDFKRFSDALRIGLGQAMTTEALELMDTVNLYLEESQVILREHVFHRMKDTPKDGERCILYSELWDMIVEAVYLNQEHGCIPTYDGPGFYVMSKDPFGNGVYLKYAEGDEDDSWWMPVERPNEAETEG